MSHISYLCAILAALLAVSAADADLTAKIKALNDKYVEFAHNNDIYGMVGLFTDDMVIMPEGFPTQGKTELKKQLSWVKNVKSIYYNNVEVAPMNDCANGDAYVFERSEIQTVGKDDKVMFNGKQVVIWRKVGDTYKAYIHIYNSNK